MEGENNMKNTRFLNAFRLIVVGLIVLVGMQLNLLQAAAQREVFGLTELISEIGEYLSEEDLGSVWSDCFDAIKNNDVARFRSSLRMLLQFNVMDQPEVENGQARRQARPGRNRVNDRDEQGATLLHYAAQFHRARIAQILIEEGANVNLQDLTGETPLHYAATRDSLGVAQLLVSRGADVNLRNNEGVAPLHCAAMINSVGFSEFLIDAEADVSIEDNSSKTPLHYAAMRDSLDVAQLLIAHDADINAIDSRGRNSLFYAERHYARRVYQFLKWFMDNNIEDSI